MLLSGAMNEPAPWVAHHEDAGQALLRIEAVLDGLPAGLIAAAPPAHDPAVRDPARHHDPAARDPAHRDPAALDAPAAQRARKPSTR